MGLLKGPRPRMLYRWTFTGNNATRSEVEKKGSIPGVVLLVLSIYIRDVLHSMDEAVFLRSVLIQVRAPMTSSTPRTAGWNTGQPSGGILLT